MRWEITDHAVDRFKKYYARGRSRAEARADLEYIAGQAAPLRQRSINGQELWQAGAPPVALVCKPDGARLVCVTILPPGALGAAAGEVDNEDVDEVLAAYERIRPLVERASVESRAALLQPVRTRLERHAERLSDEVKRLRALREDLRQEIGALLGSFV